MFMDPICVCPESDQVPLSLYGRNIKQLVVVFAPPAVSVICAAKINETRNADFRPDLVGSSQHSSSGAHLKSDTVQRCIIEHGTERASHSMVLNEGAAPAARINQPARIECVSHFAVVGEGV